MRHVTFDIAGIGIGPFNLGMAALADSIPQLKCIFFDTHPSFSWHPGMLLDFAKMQVPFYADLVTGAEPASPYSFLSYLKRTGRLYQFGILEDVYISRKTYNAYCLWVIKQLKNLHFGHQVVEVQYDEIERRYGLTVQHGHELEIYYARHIVIGVGSIPYVPPGMMGNDSVIHSSQYLSKKSKLLECRSVTVVGSGQSAAEIFYDLLREGSSAMKLSWITQSSRFHPMDTSKLSLEMTSPDYIDYFYYLLPTQKPVTLAGQQFLYKGINQELLSAIYGLLYERMEEKVRFLLQTNCKLTEIENTSSGLQLHFIQTELQQTFKLLTDAVVLATGYQPAKPAFLQNISDRIQYDSHGKYVVSRNYSIDRRGNEVFVQNAELNSHGFNAPDLGMGPYRNAVILNTIVGYDHFYVENEIAFQQFGIEQKE